jgi:hypothetical protein
MKKIDASFELTDLESKYLENYLQSTGRSMPELIKDALLYVLVNDIFLKIKSKTQNQSEKLIDSPPVSNKKPIMLDNEPELKNLPITKKTKTLAKKRKSANKKNLPEQK